MKLSKIASLYLLGVFAVTGLLAGCGGSVNAKIGGTVSGLAGGTSVGLLNNGSNALTVTANSDFTFSSSVSSGNNYLVTVQTQPTGETCSVTNGSGTVASSGGNVTNVQVSCVAGSTGTSAVSASISGLGSGKTVILLDNGTDPLAVLGDAITSTGGTVVKLFPTPLTQGANYSVTVGTQPANQTCLVTNGIGLIPTSGSAAAAIVTCI